jgi:flagellar basal body-associated protein FliL
MHDGRTAGRSAIDHSRVSHGWQSRQQGSIAHTIVMIIIIIALKLVAALACFFMAMMAARDAETARHKQKPIAFTVFTLFAMSFAASMAWLVTQL